MRLLIIIFNRKQKAPITLPKEVEPSTPTPHSAPPTQSAPVLAQPDVIPTNIVAAAPVTPQPEEVPPPAQFINDQPQPTVTPDFVSQPEAAPVLEDIYANVQRNESASKADHDPVHENGSSAAAPAAIDDTEAIYQNQQDLAEYIEDTGIRAVALYDYEAAAEDEISFDPDDLITHIEQVYESF